MSKASAKQRLAAIEDCKFNPSVDCRNKAECSGCGWNPAVTQRRLKRIKAKGPEVRELTQEEKDALTAEAVERIKAEKLQGAVRAAVEGMA